MTDLHDQAVDRIVAKLRQAEENRRAYLRKRWAAEEALGGIMGMSKAAGDLRHATWCESGCHAARQDIEFAVRVCCGDEAWEKIAEQLTWEHEGAGLLNAAIVGGEE